MNFLMQSWTAKYYFLSIAVIMSFSAGTSQSGLIFTKSFNHKLEKYDIEFYLPVERWLKPAPYTKDEFMQYDLVLHSPPDIEIRIDIDRDRKKLVPTVEIQRAVSTLATNDENEYIEFTKYPTSYAKTYFGADLALYADFTPKESLTSLPNARMLCLYKESRALIKFIILYQDQLDPYFKIPLKFRTEDRRVDG